MLWMGLSCYKLYAFKTIFLFRRMKGLHEADPIEYGGCSNTNRTNSLPSILLPRVFCDKNEHSHGAKSIFLATCILIPFRISCCKITRISGENAWVPFRGKWIYKRYFGGKNEIWPLALTSVLFACLRIGISPVRTFWIVLDVSWIVPTFLGS
jgi:hypothetical protein